jgi:hypothetical protein
MTLIDEIKYICKSYRISPLKLSVSIIPMLIKDKFDSIKYNLTHIEHIKQIESAYKDILEKEQETPNV